MATCETILFIDKKTSLKVDIQTYGLGREKLIVIPGGPALSKSYLINSIPNIDPLRFEVFFLSTPGHEKAWDGNKPISLRATVECYGNFIASRIDKNPFRGIAHSMGCWTLAGLAHDRRLNNISNFYIAPAMDEKMPKSLRDKLDSIKIQNPQFSSLDYLEEVLSLYFCDPDPAVIHNIIDHKSINIDVLYDLGKDSMRSIYFLPQPARKSDWAIFGERDPLSNESLKDTPFLDTLERFEVVQNAGHFPMLENYVKFSELLQKWLA